MPVAVAVARPSFRSQEAWSIASNGSALLRRFSPDASHCSEFCVPKGQCSAEIWPPSVTSPLPGEEQAAADDAILEYRKVERPHRRPRSSLGCTAHEKLVLGTWGSDVPKRTRADSLRPTSDCGRNRSYGRRYSTGPRQAICRQMQSSAARHWSMSILIRMNSAVRTPPDKKYSQGCSLTRAVTGLAVPVPEPTTRTHSRRRLLHPCIPNDKTQSDVFEVAPSGKQRPKPPNDSSITEPRPYRDSSDHNTTRLNRIQLKWGTPSDVNHHG